MYEKFLKQITDFIFIDQEPQKADIILFREMDFRIHLSVQQSYTEKGLQKSFCHPGIIV